MSASVLDLLISAKQKDIKVLLTDLQYNNEDRDTSTWQNRRDEHMKNVIERSINDDSKVLIYIGSDHVKKNSSTEYSDGQTVKRLGCRLSEFYGDDNVSSIAYIGRSSRFDGMPPLSILPKNSTPESISLDKKDEVVIIPNEGPLKANPRVGRRDYIITIL